MTPCAMCRKDVKTEPRYTLTAFGADGDVIVTAVVCSVSCLTEWAWRERESHPKLSKSKTS